MKQVVQSYKTGKLEVLDVPAPAPRKNHLTVRLVASAVSLGTEKSMVELARKSLVGKALARPDLVKQVIAKAQSEGIQEAWRQAMGRLDVPVALGYSAAGVVEEVGPGVEGFTKGDRVACAGQGFAGHAEAVSVPLNLCVKVPDDADLESAAFVALGAIALEAVRMARVAVGENVIVIGLGLLGQLAIQMIRAAGCHGIGMDIDPAKTEAALQHGAEDGAADYTTLAEICRQHTGGQGADAAIIFAATDSNEPLERAAELCRERGRVVVVGQVPMDVPRKPFYDKALELVVSRAWGPGLYDRDYTERSSDYPYGYSRWTARRNMSEFLNLLSTGAVKTDYLITHRFPIDRAVDAYQLLIAGKEQFTGVLLTYHHEVKLGRKVYLKPVTPMEAGEGVAEAPGSPIAPIGVGAIGGGKFAKETLLPAVKKLAGIRLRGIATASGLSGRHVGRKFGFEYATTETQEVLADPEIALVMVLTPHNTHAKFVVEALKAGKHVFVEKPLALNLSELQSIARTYEEVNNKVVSARPQGAIDLASPKLMVGFNRAFSPSAVEIKRALSDRREPMVIGCRINAGYIDPDSPDHDPDIGGGRIVGEACHFVDLIQFFTDAMPVNVYAETVSGGSGNYLSGDNVTATLKMSDGSVGTIMYTAAGDKAFPREMVEIFCDGAVYVIDNFKSWQITKRGHKAGKRGRSVDRGYGGELASLFDCVRGSRPFPISFESYVLTSLATFCIEESRRRGVPVAVDPAVVYNSVQEGGQDQ